MKIFQKGVYIIALVVIIVVLMRTYNHDTMPSENSTSTGKDTSSATGGILDIPGEAESDTGATISDTGDTKTYTGTADLGIEMSQTEQETIVEDYIRKNIARLSPEPAVLGGTFYVTQVTFGDLGRGIVEYEDGHIALIADFSYSVDDHEEVEVVLSNVRD